MMLKVGGVRDECPSQSAATVTEDRVRAHHITESLGRYFNESSVSLGKFWIGWRAWRVSIAFGLSMLAKRWGAETTGVTSQYPRLYQYDWAQSRINILTLLWIILIPWNNWSPGMIWPSDTSTDFSSPDIWGEVICLPTFLPEITLRLQTWQLRSKGNSLRFTCQLKLFPRSCLWKLEPIRIWLRSILKDQNTYSRSSQLKLIW